MRASLQALMHGLIDYAGMFPPAKLPFAEALTNYQRYQREADHWMLGRFVVPAARLGEFPPCDVICSALTGSAESGEAFLAALDADLDAIARSPVRVDVLEAKLPNLDVLDETIQRVSARGLALFVEVPPSLSRETIAARPPGFKLRAGGVEPSAYPSSEQVAHVLVDCIHLGVRFKATAGLHHPLPRPPMHGFVNLFVAGVLIHARGIGFEQVVDLLHDSDPSSFVYTDDELRWKDVTATTAEIRAARQSVVLSFGSCSFDEPREDLQHLGWK